MSENTPQQQEGAAVLVGVDFGLPHFDSELEELGLLAQTAGLTAAEVREGWKPLFDGQSLEGWTLRPMGGGRRGGEPPPPGQWAAENGELVWVKDTGRGYLVSEQVFNDFVLRLDFWVDGDANAGVNFGVPATGNISSIRRSRFRIIQSALARNTCSSPPFRK